MAKGEWHKVGKNPGTAWSAPLEFTADLLQCGIGVCRHSLGDLRFLYWYFRFKFSFCHKLPAWNKRCKSCPNPVKIQEKLAVKCLDAGTWLGQRRYLPPRVQGLRGESTKRGTLRWPVLTALCACGFLWGEGIRLKSMSINASCQERKGLWFSLLFSWGKLQTGFRGITLGTELFQGLQTGDTRGLPELWTSELLLKQFSTFSFQQEILLLVSPAEMLKHHLE